MERPVKSLLAAMVRLYQRFLSPILPPSCRFHPSCSNYALQALQYRSLGKALLLVVWRLMRCNPWNAGGYDPLEPEAKTVSSTTQDTIKDKGLTS